MPDTQPSDDRPMLFETGRDSSLADFIQANDDALTMRDQKLTDLRAQIKNQPGKKNELEEKIELAAGRADSVRDALQRGARLAFLAGHPEKVQAMMADPARFICVKKDLPQGEATYKAENIILLMFASKIPADVPGIALANVVESDKPAILEYTLFRLLNAHTKIEPLAFSLLQAGAKADGVILAEAVRKNASLALIEQLLDHGADYNAALDVMRGNPGYFGDSAQKLATIRETLAQKNENKLDITSRGTAHLLNPRPTPRQLTVPRFHL